MNNFLYRFIRRVVINELIKIVLIKVIIYKSKNQTPWSYIDI